MIGYSDSTAEPDAMANKTDSYSSIARLLHWLVAGGIVLQYMLGDRAADATEAGERQLTLISLAQHKSIGITVLMLATLRILWRLLNPPPPLPTTYVESRPALARLSTIVHLALYGLLFFLPLSGWLMSSASAYSVSWFNIFQLPDLIAPSETAKDWLRSAHHLGAKALFVLALLHIAAAFKHLLIDKNHLMGRMANGVSVALFGLTLALGIWFTWPAPGNAKSTSVAPAVAADEKVSSATQEPLTERAAVELPRWQIDPDRSYIRFSAQQAGAEFSGQWQRFTADIEFDSKALASSSAVVRIDATSVATQDSERDSTLAASDWFDSQQFSDVVFATQTFAVKDPENAASPGKPVYTADATLSIRGNNYPVKFRFSVTSAGNSRTLKGQARLDRLALNLGTQEWSDTDWVGQFVDVQVQVEATVP